MKNRMRNIGSIFTAILLSAVMMISIGPAAVYADLPDSDTSEPAVTDSIIADSVDSPTDVLVEDNSVVDTEKSGKALSEPAPVKAVTWNRCGTCLWGIDDDGCLIIKPEDGVSGTLNNWGHSTNPMSKAPWYDKRLTIKSVEIEKEVFAPTCANMFYGFGACTSFDLSGLNTSQTVYMTGMFDNCTAITNIDVSTFNTSKVTTMSLMFADCPNLTNLDLSNFNTSNVEDMSAMFASCEKLVSVDVSSFDTKNVKYMKTMFNNCYSLASLDITNFDTRNVTSFAAMFVRCRTLTSLDLSRLDTSSAKDINSMFMGSYNLLSLDLSNFKTENVTDMNQMFMGCEKMESVNVSSFNTSNVTQMKRMFAECKELRELDISNFDTTTTATKTEDMFRADKNLRWLKVGDNFGAAPTNYLKAKFPRDLYYTADDSLKSMNSIVPYDVTSDAIYAVRYKITYDQLDDYEYLYYQKSSNAGNGKSRASGTTVTLNDGSSFSDVGTFMGWDTDSEAKTVVFEPSQSVNFKEFNNVNGAAFDYPTSEEVVVLYPVIKKKVSLYYDPNGGSGAPETDIIESLDDGKTFIVSDIAPVKDGYSFLGWSTQSEATEAEYLSGDTIEISSDLTLYAVWKKNPTPPADDSDSDSNSNSNSNSNVSKGSATGDSSSIILFSLMMLTSAFLMLGLLLGRRRRNM